MTEQQSVDLTEIFDNRQQELKVRLERVRGLTHPTAAGDEGENGWCEVLRDFLPDRYAVDRHRFVIDASGSISEQQDIVVYDSVYAPTFLVLGDTQFIPVEAVYAVFEVKSRLDKITLEAAADKVQSVRRLKMQPAEFGVVRDEDGDLSFPPLNKHQAHSILGGILTRETTYSDPFGNTFRKALESHTGTATLDLGCVVDAGSFLKTSDELRVSPADRALIAFCVSLFDVLQKTGNATAVDASTYGQDLWK